jgi:hypothetical protein
VKMGHCPSDTHWKMSHLFQLVMTIHDNRMAVGDITVSKL